jgi:hypothetical protein
LSHQVDFGGTTSCRHSSNLRRRGATGCPRYYFNEPPHSKSTIVERPRPRPLSAMRSGAQPSGNCSRPAIEPPGRRPDGRGQRGEKRSRQALARMTGAMQVGLILAAHVADVLAPIAVIATANWCISRSRRRRCAAIRACRWTPTPARSGGGFEFDLLGGRLLRRDCLPQYALKHQFIIAQVRYVEFLSGLCRRQAAAETAHLRRAETCRTVGSGSLRCIEPPNARLE